MKKFVYVLIIILITVTAIVAIFPRQHHRENFVPEEEEQLIYATYNVTGKGTIEFQVNSTWSEVGINVYYDPYKVKGGEVYLLGPGDRILVEIKLEHVSQSSGIWCQGEGLGTEFYKLKGANCKVEYNIVGEVPVRIDIIYDTS